MTQNVRKINKLLNWFWACVLLAPIVSWLMLSAVSAFQGTLPQDTITCSDMIRIFIGFDCSTTWLDSIWSALFGLNGFLPFTNTINVSLPVINYLLFWCVTRLFISIFVWVPCFAQKIIERWFE